jgi:hypothetical protein
MHTSTLGTAIVIEEEDIDIDIERERREKGKETAVRTVGVGRLLIQQQVNQIDDADYSAGTPMISSTEE